MRLGRNRLHNVALVRVLFGFGVLNISEWGFNTALSVHAFRVGGPLDVGLIGIRLLAGAASSAMIAPIFATRKGALGAVALTRTCLLGAAALLAIDGGAFLLILVFVVADAMVAAVYRPAQSRLMPSLATSPSELTQAVAGSSFSKTIGQATGALIAGAAVQVISPEATMACAAGVMLIAMACTAGITGNPVQTKSEERGRGLRNGLAAFPEVLRIAYAWPLVVASVLRTLVRGLWGALLVVVALRLLHSGNSSVGVLQAATGIGAFVALPVTAAQIGRTRLALPCAAAFILAGITVGLIGAASALWVVSLLVFLWGLAMAMADATSLSLLHRVMAAQLFSRTVGVMESLKLVAEGSGALMAPALVAIFGLRGALFVAGLPLPLVVAATWVRLRQSDELAVGRGSIVALIHGLDLFSGLDMASLEQLASAAVEVEISSGQEPVVQGDIGDRYYAIKSGRAEAVIDGHKVRELTAGEGFGDRALLRNTPRTATIRALTDMRLLAVDREAFLEALTGERGVQVDYGDLLTTPTETVLRSLAIFAGAAPGSLARVESSVTRRTLPAATVAIEEGDAPDAVYVILAGRVDMIADGQVSSILVPGDCFGELAVLHGTPQKRRALVAEPTTVLVIPPDVVIAESPSADPSVRPERSRNAGERPTLQP